jgi:sodium/hydrogen exchanger-like protein 6/7
MVGRELHFSDLIEGSFYFVTSFFGSLTIGVSSGLGTALLLKFTKLSEFPGTEACIITLIAYGTYFFSNAVHMSGIYTNISI